ncbi:hypothetical protein [Marilutibacter aestuarii]|uniref:Uncharacterized protein n=1 Tax=Marilutibacter aestuarii TaxID=1706195 RepID=A0A508A929_9GAMM|nr:hypothetical protein [Lysobacter aestuarii]TQD46380.1 hypothetical protein FKV25_06970 [Lysobacter aestuarii]
MKTFDTHPADKAYRRRLAWLLSLAALLGLPLLVFFGQWLAEVADSLRQAPSLERRQGLRVLLAGLGLGMGVAAAGMAAAIGQRRRDILETTTLPPPHWRTIRDVRILRGQSALAWGRRLGWARNAAATIAAASLAASAWALVHYA